MKKSLLKASSIISYIYAGLFAFSGLMFLILTLAGSEVWKAYADLAQEDFELVAGVLGIVFGTITIMFIAFAVLVFFGGRRMNHAYNGTKPESLGWGIALIFFALPAGICAVIANFQDNTPTGQYNDLEKQLNDLQGLLDRNLITQEEFEQRRKAIIEKV